MRLIRNQRILFVLFFSLLFCFSCKTEFHGNIQKVDRKPIIEPDYPDVTIPPNIAPMNFVIKEDAKHYKISATAGTSAYQIDMKSSDGIIRFSEKSWRRLIKDCEGGKIKIQVFSSNGDEKNQKQYEPFYFHVSKEPIDPYLAYRIIHPGYYNWSKLIIAQRSLENYWEKSIVENQLMEKNCINCHSFNQNNPERFLIHVRGSKGGTYIVEDGEITRRDLKIESMPGGATYPSWHPGGRYIAFSSNQVRQSFYSHSEKSIEVYDLVSSLIIYDRENNEIVNITDQDTTDYLQTFPTWSPDGKYLYFCMAVHNNPGSHPDLTDIKNTHYSLARKSFNPESRSFGESEIVFNAAELNKSASFPRISPDGKFLIFTLHDYGTFPIWHQEADLYLLNMQSGESKKMSLNSSETDSYHTWSTNSKWLVFSSKRADGRSTRPYFAYIDSWDRIGKPFVLPQKDPTLYNRMLESFNIPEFVAGRINIKPRDFEDAARQESIKSNPGNPLDTLRRSIEIITRDEPSNSDRAVH